MTFVCNFIHSFIDRLEETTYKYENTIDEREVFIIIIGHRTVTCAKTPRFIFKNRQIHRNYNVRCTVYTPVNDMIKSNSVSSVHLVRKT